jgi:chromosome segregation ATPase
MGDMFASAASAVLSDQPGLSGAPSADMSSLDGATAASTTGAAADPAAAASSSAAAAASGGNASAKEAQLTRLVETLRKRLEVVRGENQQLEDMLHEAEQRSSAEQAAIAKLSADLTALQREQEGLVSSAAANAAAQDAHIGRLQAELEASSRQVSALQAELQAVQEQHAQALSSKDSMEGGALEGGFDLGL